MAREKDVKVKIGNRSFTLRFSISAIQTFEKFLKADGQTPNYLEWANERYQEYVKTKRLRNWSFTEHLNLLYALLQHHHAGENLTIDSIAKMIEEPSDLWHGDINTAMVQAIAIAMPEPEGGSEAAAPLPEKTDTNGQTGNG